MNYFKCIEKLPSGLRIRRLLETIWAELTFAQSCAPGHFYSPIPSRKEIEQDSQRIFGTGKRQLPEICLNEQNQISLLNRLATHSTYLKLPELPIDGRRFYLKNDYFAFADAVVLATMLLEFKPRRYLEIGSGFSSALVLDIRDHYLAGQLECCFVEPSDTRLKSLLNGDDTKTATILTERVQNVDDSIFQALEAGDILFVDGSHVSKVGSDLNDIVFRVLPLLRPGVMVHFHDILWPFEYARADVLLGRSWNEAYLIRAFLANNSDYEIVLFPSWLENSHPIEWIRALPEASRSKASSFWIRKLGPAS